MNYFLNHNIKLKRSDLDVNNEIEWKLDLLCDMMVRQAYRADERVRGIYVVSVAQLRHEANQVKERNEHPVRWA